MAEDALTIEGREPGFVVLLQLALCDLPTWLTFLGGHWCAKVTAAEWVQIFKWKCNSSMYTSILGK